MKQQYYTEEEKRILDNFFVQEGLNCKKDFKEYMENFVTKYGKRVHDKDPTKIVKSIVDELGNFEYASPPYVWGNENNDNLVTYVFSQTNFIMSSTKLKNLEKLKVDWNHINNQGENFLFYIQMYKINEWKELIKEQEVQTDLINNMGEVFFINIFKNYRSRSKNINDCRLEDVRLTDTINFISDYEHLIAVMTEEKIEAFKHSFHECTDIIEKKLYEIAKKENKIQRMYDEDKENGNLPYEEQRQYMNKIFNYHLLNKKLVIDDTKGKVKKVKI